MICHLSAAATCPGYRSTIVATWVDSTHNGAVTAVMSVSYRWQHGDKIGEVDDWVAVGIVLEQSANINQRVVGVCDV